MNPASEKNIILIGMCGVGKSTVGILTAKLTGRDFADTDVVIQASEGRGLQDIIDNEGLEYFCRLEEMYVLSIDIKGTVIATGGSVVYSDKAMKHLAEDGIIVHLDLDIDTIEKRVTNIYTRGIVMETGENLRSLYAKRQPIYEKYAQIRIDCTNKTQQQIAEEIAEKTVSL